MKRICSVFLSLMVMLSLCVSPAYAAEDISILPEVQTVDDFEPTASAVVTSEQPIELYDNNTTVLCDGENNIFEMDNPAFADLDCSSAIDITDTLTPITADSIEPSYEINAFADLPENLPPVANFEFLVLNPESMQDEQYTTATRFIILTRYNNVDLCYDPEGGPIQLLTNSSFPAGYISYQTSSDGSLAGYVIQIHNEGTYPFAFAFVDQYGAASDIFPFNFTIVRRGTWSSFEGELNSATDTELYTFTVDYSSADEYCLSLLRTGLGGVTATVKHPNGTKVTAASCDGPKYTQFVGKSVLLKRPDGVDGEYTYNLEVSTTEGAYQENDTSYRIVYGESSQVCYFFEDVSNCMELPYCETVRGIKDARPIYVQESAPSSLGHYYKMTATGPEAVTLTSNQGQYQFRILDCDTLTVLFDSNESVDTIDYGEYAPDYYTTAMLDFEAGQSYYIVVYNLDDATQHGMYSIRVGKRALVYGKNTYTISEMNVQAKEYPFTLSLRSPTTYPVYVDKVYYHKNEVDMRTVVEFRTPASSTRYLLPVNNVYNFNFENNNFPLVRADGTWEFYFTFKEAKLYKGGTIDIGYWYEV